MVAVSSDGVGGGDPAVPKDSDDVQAAATIEVTISGSRVSEARGCRNCFQYDHALNSQGWAANRVIALICVCVCVWESNLVSLYSMLVVAQPHN